MKSLALLFGGRSCEHAVSVISARSVLAAIDSSKYQIALIGISESGQWQWAPGSEFESLIEGGKVKEGAGVCVALDLAEAGRLLALDELKDGINLPHIDVVFPVLHGTYGEDGAVQGLLELADIAYVGCPVAASANGMDKVLAKKLFTEANIPQAQHVLINLQHWSCDKQAVLNASLETLAFPMFIKPASMGSSVGISKAHDTKQLQAAIDLAMQFDSNVLVEASFEGCAEVECAVLGNEDPKASIVGEIDAGAEFYDYEAKYISDVSSAHIPADIPKQSSEKVRKLSIKAFQAIEGQGLSRVDFFVSRQTGEVWLNEINTMPGFTPISMYPKLWAASGLPYGELIDKLVKLADERHLIKKKLRRSV